MGTVVQIKHILGADVGPTQFAPSSRNNDSDSCLGGRIQDKVGHAAGIIYDNAPKADI